MAVLLILILASLGIALAFLLGFMWSVKSGQFDDTFTPSMRILAEDEPRHQSPITNHQLAAPKCSGGGLPVTKK
jgi:cbb3-type cytochrome oxidase maturation protein